MLAATFKALQRKCQAGAILDPGIWPSDSDGALFQAADGKIPATLHSVLADVYGSWRTVEFAQSGSKWQAVAGWCGRKILGMYVNELLVRLVPRGLGSQSLFACYEKTLRHLASDSAEPEPALRLFELKLLELSGFIIPLERDCETDEPLLSERCYYHEPGKGFSAYHGSAAVAKSVFSGQTLLALRGGLRERSPQIMREAKRLLHSILDEKFRKRPLRVREIMKKLYSLRNAK